MDQKERMHSKRLYYPGDPELTQEQARCLEILYDFNATRPSELKKRLEILKKLFAAIGQGCYIEPPLHANWGRHVHMGNDVYANFNLTLVDDTDIYIGDNVMIGPNVTLVTGTHPVRPDLRLKQVQYNVPVTLEANVWIGAGAIVLPGVRIGRDSVIGAGSVVTKDVPAGVVAVGNPCRVLREINERDRQYYYRDMRIDIE